MKKVSGSLKLAYSQYRELQAFSQFASDLDKDTKERLAKGERIVEVLKQNKNEPMSVEHQVIIIYAVVNNFLKDIPVKYILDFQKELFSFIDNSYPDITKTIKETKDLDESTEKLLVEALEMFINKYMKDKQ